MEHYAHLIKKNLTPAGLLSRMAAAYLTMLLYFLRRTELNLMDFAFFQEISLVGLLGGTLLLFLLLNLIPWRKVIMFWTLYVGVLYSYRAIVQVNTNYFVFGCIAVLALFIFYTDVADVEMRIPTFVTWIACLAMFLLLTYGVGRICILRFYNNNASCFDFGIFAQMFYYLKEHGTAMTTCERDMLLSHFKVHVSPIFYLLVPIYKIVPHPTTLMVLHCAITFSGIFPLILLCRRHKLSNLATLCFGACYLLYPTFTGASFYYIHENNFLPPLILLFILCLEWEMDSSSSRKMVILKKAACIASLSLVLFIKEDAPVYAAVISFYFLILACKKAYKDSNWKSFLCSPALWALILSLIYFILALKVFLPDSTGAITGTARYDNYIYDGSGSLMIMLLGILKNPIYVISQCFTAEKLLFLAYMLLPLGLLPFLTKKMDHWILVIPLLLFNLMTNYIYQYDINFQYAYGSGVLLIYLAVINYSALPQQLRRKLLMLAICSAFLIYSFHYGAKFRNYKSDRDNREAYRTVMQEAFSYIPDDASVTASTWLVPALSQRDIIYELETTQQLTEYCVVDLRGAETESSLAYDPRYEELFYSEGIVAVYRYINWDPDLE